MRTTDEELYMLKQAEFYSANINAWLATRFERDKSLLALSTGAIGLLLTLISTVGVKSLESLVLYLFTLFCFLSCLVSVLFIFKENARYLEKVANGGTEGDRVLAALDKVAVYSFMAGIALASIIGASTAIQSYIDKAKPMTDDKKTTIVQVELMRKSLNNFSSMSPIGPKTGSTEGIHNLRPQSPTIPAATPVEKPKDSK